MGEISEDKFSNLEGYGPTEIEYHKQYDLEQEIDTNFQFKESVQSGLDEVLEDLGEADDRKIDVTQLNKELVEIIFHNLKHDSNFLKIASFSIDEWIWAMFNQDELKSLFDHLKNFFDITDDELEDELRQRRFGLEVCRAALQIELYRMEQQLESSQKKVLELHRDSQDITITRQELDNISPEVLEELSTEEQNKFAEIYRKLTQEERNDLMEEEALKEPLYSQTEAEPLDSGSIPEKIILVQFDMINELELKLRELLKKVFSEYNDWWEKYVPIEVRDKCEYRNRKDPNFSGLRKDQSLELIDLLMFREVQIIITGSGFDNYEFFKNIFPNYHYVNERLIEASLLRNPVCHMNKLNEKQHKQLLHIKEELVDHINEYLGV